jgi:hypothetical protein
MLSQISRQQQGCQKEPRFCFVMNVLFEQARDAMRSSLPLPFRDGSFMRALKNDQTTKKCLQQLLTVLQVPVTEPAQ